MSEIIDVSYKTYTTAISIRNILKELNNHSLLAFDTETRSKYTKAERAEVKELLKYQEELSMEDRLLCKMVNQSSGLSHPKISEVTHWIFSYEIESSIIIITENDRLRQMVADFVVSYKGKLVVHNAGFDLKIVHYLTGKFPIDYEDTQLLAKCYLNHTNVWKAKVGLKDLMGQSYSADWARYNEYDVDDLKDEKFLAYMAIDTSAVLLLFDNLKEHK